MGQNLDFSRYEIPRSLAGLLLSEDCTAAGFPAAAQTRRLGLHPDGECFAFGIDPTAILSRDPSHEFQNVPRLPGVFLRHIFLCCTHLIVDAGASCLLV